jgi:hypothetical protein
MKKTVVALALATAASAAFATARDPNKECFESPQYPHGTPACTQPTPPPGTASHSRKTCYCCRTEYSRCPKHGRGAEYSCGTEHRRCPAR